MVRADKRLGQHFLRDMSVVERAVSALEVRPDDVVLEVGPGQGVLTTALADAAARVVAVELDPGLVATLQVTMPEHVDIVRGDILKVDLEALGPFDLVTGNLPYQISSPVTFRLLDVPCRRAVFLYQLEFAERLVANVGEPAYGRLSVTRAYRGSARLLRRVKPGAFVPAPRVRSGLVQIDPYEVEPFDIGGDVAWFDHVVRELFTQRRKTLRKALSNQARALGLPPGTEHVDAWLAEAECTDERVETLSPQRYGRLAAVLGAAREDGHG